MESVINSAMKKGSRVSIKILKKNQPPMIYSDYSKRMDRFYMGLSRDIKDDLEACVYDFVDERVVLSVTPLDKPEQLYEMFEWASPTRGQDPLEHPFKNNQNNIK